MIPEIFSTDPTWPHTKAKTAVIAAASAVICEEGPRAATLKNIAYRAGITEPAIFRHFEGVDGLFEGLFSSYERVHQRYASAFSAGEGKGMAKLRAACVAYVGGIAASQDFSYILINARHVFRGYPELKAKVAENDSKLQGAVLTCIAEGIKSGEVRTDIDPVSAASSLIGSMHLIAQTWIDSGFGFDIRQAFGDRWDDFERMAAAKPVPKSREAKAGSKDRSAAYYPLRPATAVKAKGAAGKRAGASAADSRRKAKAEAKTAKADAKAPKSARKSPAKKAAPAKKTSSKAK